VILADSSAWIEFLRATGSDLNRRLRALLERDQLATTDAVVMEVLAGGRDAAHRRRLHGLLLRCVFIATQPTDYENAAEISRACRRTGDRLPGLIDCLIASVAIRAEVQVLNGDADFNTIARHTPLALA
jgi:predicted nucleic acid-binding protein